MPVYKCPITGQTGHLHIDESFYDWAVKYFGEFHTYEDKDLVPVPCHAISVQAGNPKTHAEFVEWCVAYGCVAWVPEHIASGKVAGIAKVFNRATSNGAKRRRKKVARPNKVSAIKSRISKKALLQANANIAALRKKKEAEDLAKRKRRVVLTRKRKAAAKKAVATRRERKTQIDADAKKRSDAAKRAWITRRKNQR